MCTVEPWYNYESARLNQQSSCMYLNSSWMYTQTHTFCFIKFYQFINLFIKKTENHQEKLAQ
jgi:hypothetical protein